MSTLTIEATGTSSATMEPPVSAHDTDRVTAFHHLHLYHDEGCEDVNQKLLEAARQGSCGALVVLEGPRGNSQSEHTGNALPNYRTLAPKTRSRQESGLYLRTAILEALKNALRTAEHVSRVRVVLTVNFADPIWPKAQGNVREDRTAKDIAELSERIDTLVSKGDLDFQFSIVGANTTRGAMGLKLNSVVYRMPNTTWLCPVELIDVDQLV